MAARSQEIAGRIARAIQGGVLRPGDRLPSLRSACRSHGASLMTALAAYRRLEDLGLVEAQPRSGYRVLGSPVPSLSRPAITRPRLHAHSRQRSDVLAQVLAAISDPRLVALGFGCPDADLYPRAALKRLTAGLLNRGDDPWLRYSTPPGHAELRRRIAQRYQARGLDVGPDDVLVTTGAMEALTLCLRLLVSPGDLVAVECPTFFGIVDAAWNAGAQLVELPGDPGRGVDPAGFDAVCRRRSVRAAVLMPTFANPSGSLMDEGRKRAWAEVLHRSGTALIEDDIYGELSWDGRRHTPLAAFARGDAVPSLLVGSFSKSLLPGGRVGYVVARRPWIERLTDLKSTSTLANTTLAEALVAECLASGLFDRHLRRAAPRLHAGVGTLREGVARHFPPGTRVSDPRGGFLLWVELPRGTDGLALFQAALESGISVAPGCLFTRGAGLGHFLRLNGGALAGVDRAIATLGRLAHEARATARRRA